MLRRYEMNYISASPNEGYIYTVDSVLSATKGVQQRANHKEACNKGRATKGVQQRACNKGRATKDAQQMDEIQWKTMIVLVASNDSDLKADFLERM